MAAFPHRKRVRHFHESGDVHEFTFSCFQRLPLLTNGTWCRWLCESFDLACERHRLGLLAYVIMPEHVHAIVAPLETTVNVPRFLSDTKRKLSIQVKRALTEQRSSLLSRLIIQQRPQVTTFRFWQEGPGYDRNVTEGAAILTAINYIHDNPVRRGLCLRAVDWQWSSARRLLLDQPLDREPPRLMRFDPATMSVS